MFNSICLSAAMGIVFAFAYLILSASDISELGWKAFLRACLPGSLALAMMPPIFLFGAYAVLVGIPWFEENIDPCPPLGIGVCFDFLVNFYGISQMPGLNKTSIFRLAAYALAATVAFVALGVFVASVDIQTSIVVLMLLLTVPILVLSDNNPAAEDSNEQGTHEHEQQTGRIVHQSGEPKEDYQRPSGSLWLQRNRALLPPQQWSAANENGLVASDPDFVGLMAKLKELNVSLAAVTIDFNETDGIG